MRARDLYRADMEKLRLDVWSDIACPWCYIGKRRLESALAAFPERENVDVVWHAFELDPSAPRERDATESHAARIAKKYGKSLSEAEKMIQRVTDVAADDGLQFRFDIARSGNTFDAHRLVRLGAEHGLQGALKERLLAAYFSHGESVGNTEVLQRIGVEAGLDSKEVSELLASDRFAAEVRADEAAAQKIGISGVPFFVMGGKFGVSGAQPAELLLSALNEAWAQQEEEPAAHTEGAVCGPEGC